jgi:hypothetical protein
MSKFTRFNAGKGITFMDTCEKAQITELFDKVVHITDYGYIKGDTGEYAVLTVEETPGKFYFANSIVTDMLHEVDEQGLKGEIKDAPIKFVKRVSKRGRNYVGYEFLEG